MALLSPKYPHHANIYVWDENEESATTEVKPNSSAWIVITSIREDSGRDIAISMPPKAKLNETVSETLSNSEIFGWNESHIFVALRPSLSTMIAEIEAHVKRNRISVCPCYFYLSDPLDALNFDPELNPDVAIKSLDAETGADFICGNWRYGSKGSLECIHRFMRINPSCGVFVKNENGDEELVSGMVLPNNGLMGMLFTKKEHRNHQYGTLAMKSLMKEISLQGLIPCSTVDSYNQGSQLFHSKVGMKFSHHVDFVLFEKFDLQ